MAYDIGPRIGIEGEKEFRDAINQINTNMKTLGTEMQAVASQFDKNDKSTEAYTAKNEVLNKMIEEQRKKLTELSKGLSSAADKYGENDKVTQGWRQAVNKATADLNNMERELKDNTKAMDSTGDATKQLGKDLDAAGEKALSFGDVLKANIIGTAIVDGIKALGGAFKDLARDAINSADSIQKMADQTGMSAEQIQEWQYIGDTLGTSIETITGSQRKLTKSMSEARDGSEAYSEAFKKLGISVTDSEGNLRDAKTVMLEAFNALRGVGNETERDAIAMEIFGRSAAELNPLIKAPTEEINKLAQQARDTGAIMSGEAVEGLDNFGDTLGQLKQSAMATAGSILSELTPSIEPFVEKVREIDTSGITNALKWILDNAGNIAAGLAGIGAGFAAFQVVGMIQGVVGAIKAYQLANEGATIAQWALNVAMSANPIGIVIALVAALVAGIAVLWNTNEDFRNAVVSAWNGISETGKAVFGEITQFFTVDIPNAFNNVINFLKDNWSEVLLFITNPIGGALTFLYKLNPQFKEWVDGVWRTIVDTFESIGDVDWIELGSNIIKGIAAGVRDAASNLASSVAEAAKDALDAAKDFLGIQSPSKVMRDQVGRMIGAGMAEGISDSARQVDSAMAGLNSILVAGRPAEVDTKGESTSSSAAAGDSGNTEITLHTYTTLDGKVVAKSSSRVQAQKNRQKSRSTGVALA